MDRPLSLFRKIFDLISRAVVKAKRPDRAMRTLQTEHLLGDVREDVEHFEPYGFTSEPHLGAEVLAASINGDRNHTIAVIVSDRRYRIKDLKDGEVAIYDDLGKVVILKREEILVDAKDSPVTVQSGSKVTIKAPEVLVDAANSTFTGNIKAAGEIEDKKGTMSAIRSTFNSHTHNGGYRPDQTM